MQIINENKTDQQVIFEFKLAHDEWAPAVHKAMDHAVKSLKIDGYRPGKVPLEYAKKYISMDDVYTRAVNSLLPKFVEDFETNNEAFKKYDDEVIDESRVAEIIRADDNDAEIRLTYDLFPVVTVGDYKHNDLPKFVAPEVTQDEINAELDRVARSKKVVEEKTDGVLENGDIAVFDFTGYKNGEQFAGGSAKNYELEIGSNQFIPGFEEKMVGMRLGEERDLNLTFPENYSAKDLAGQPVVFKVHLSEMKRVVLPTVDDALVKELGIPDVATVPEYIEYFKKQVVANAEQNFMAEQTAKIVNMIVDLTHVANIPQIMINEERRALYDAYDNQLKQQGLSIEQYLSIVKQPREEFEKNLESEAHRSVLLSLGMQEIAKQEGITITEDDIMGYIEKVVKIYGGDAKEIREKIGDQTGRIESTILQQKVFDAVASYAEGAPVVGATEGADGKRAKRAPRVKKTDAKVVDHPETTAGKETSGGEKVAPEEVKTGVTGKENPTEREDSGVVKTESTPDGEQGHHHSHQSHVKGSGKTGVHEASSSGEKDDVGGGTEDHLEQASPSEAAPTVDEPHVAPEEAPHARSTAPENVAVDGGKPAKAAPKKRGSRGRKEIIQMEIPETIKYDGEASDFHIDPDKEFAKMHEQETLGVIANLHEGEKAEDNSTVELPPEHSHSHGQAVHTHEHKHELEHPDANVDNKHAEPVKKARKSRSVSPSLAENTDPKDGVKVASTKDAADGKEGTTKRRAPRGSRTKDSSDAPAEPKLQQRVTPISEYVEIVENVPVDDTDPKTADKSEK